MGRVHIWLKRSFIAVTSLIAIITVLMLGLTVIGHGIVGATKEYSSDMEGVHYMYAASIIPLVLTVFGLFGACKMKKWALIVFAVGMILLSLIFFFVAAIGYSSKSEIKEELRKEHLDYGPLPETSHEFQQELFELQIAYQCCGMDQGHDDWGLVIPSSCECTGNPLINPCTEVNTDTDQVFMVYEKPCLPYLLKEYMDWVEILLGLMMALSLLLILSVVLCIIILCKLFEKEDSPAVIYHAGVN